MPNKLPENLSAATHSMSIEHHGKEYVLVRTNSKGRKSEMLLSEVDVFIVSKLIQESIHKIIAERSNEAMKNQGISPIMAIPAAQAKVSLDVPKSEVFLTIRDQFGNESCFALSYEIAQPLSERLFHHVAEIHQKRQTINSTQ